VAWHCGGTALDRYRGTTPAQQELSLAERSPAPDPRATIMRRLEEMSKRRAQSTAGPRISPGGRRARDRQGYGDRAPAEFDRLGLVVCGGLGPGSTALAGGARRFLGPWPGAERVWIPGGDSQLTLAVDSFFDREGSGR